MSTTAPVPYLKFASGAILSFALTLITTKLRSKRPGKPSHTTESASTDGGVSKAGTSAKGSENTATVDTGNACNLAIEKIDNLFPSAGLRENEDLLAKFRCSPAQPDSAEPDTALGCALRAAWQEIAKQDVAAAFELWKRGAALLQDQTLEYPAYEYELERLTRASRAASYTLAQAPAREAVEAYKIHTRDAATLSIAECHSQYVAHYCPLVIKGLEKVLLPPEAYEASSVSQWLRDVVGNKRTGVFQKNSHLGYGYSVEGGKGAGLEVAFVTIRELLDRVESGAGEGCYCYDLSLPMKLPALLEHVRVPRYFVHDYLMQTRQLHAWSRSWPSLFIGAAGTHSSLHVDQWKGHFWMYMLSGHKRWTIFHPDDIPLLYPSYARGTLDPQFPDLRAMDAQKERYPNVARARRAEVLLGPGQILYVPGGAPHYVENTDNTIAIAGNFIEKSNCEFALNDIRLMAARQGGPMAESFAALDEVEFDSDDRLVSELLEPAQLVVPYIHYKSGAAASFDAYTYPLDE